MNTRIWCCVWGSNCRCASGTLGEPSGLTFLSLLTPCNHWGKDCHYLLPAELFPGRSDLAPKAYRYLKNFRAAVNGPENVCEQSGRLASGRFPGSWTPWIPAGPCWRFSEVRVLLSVGCEKVGIGSERPPSPATGRAAGKTDLFCEVGPPSAREVNSQRPVLKHLLGSKFCWAISARSDHPPPPGMFLSSPCLSLGPDQTRVTCVFSFPTLAFFFLPIPAAVGISR